MAFSVVGTHYFFCLVLLGVERRWWNKLAGMWDIASGASTVEVAPVGGADTSARPSSMKPQTMRQSAEELSLKRRSCHNTLHFVAMVLARPMCRSVVALIVAITRPVREAQGRAVTQCKTRRGGADWVQSMAQEG